jgi:hypothetical protein
MADGKWEHDIIRFQNKGLDVLNPIEDIPEGFYSRFTNAQSLQEGSIVARTGITKVNSGAISGTPEVHSIIRLENPASGNTIRVIGAGTIVWTGETGFTNRSTGWSGEPLTMVAWRTFLDDETWIYIGDRAKTERINQAGTAVQVGLSKPQRSGTNDEFGHIRTPVVADGTPRVIYTLTTGNDATAIADWVASSYLITPGGTQDRTLAAVDDTTSQTSVTITGSTAPIKVKKPSRQAEVTTVNAVAGTLMASGEQRVYFGRHAVSGPSSTVWNANTNSLDLRAKSSPFSLIETFLGATNFDHVDDVTIIFSFEPLKDLNEAISGTYDYTDSTIASSARDLSDGSSPIANETMIRVTHPGHGYTEGDIITIDGAHADTKADGNWEITNVTANTFDLKGSVWITDNDVRGKMLNFSMNNRMGYGFQNPLAKLKGRRESVRSGIRAEMEDEFQQYQFAYDEDVEYGLLDPNMEGRMSREQFFNEYLPEGSTGGEREALEVRFRDQVKLPGGAGPHMAFSSTKDKYVRSGTDRTLSWKNVTGIMFEFGMSGSTQANEQLGFAELDMSLQEGALNSKRGAKYDWRYTFYDSETGTESLPSPIMPEGIHVVNQRVTLTFDGRDPAADQDKIRIYRRGGILTNWHLVDAVDNPGNGSTETYVDIKDDLSISATPLLKMDSNRPVAVPVKVTNHLQFSQKFNDGSLWTLTNATIDPNVIADPMHAMTADELTATAATASIKQTLTITGQTHYWSLYVKRSSGTNTVSLFYRDNGGVRQKRALTLATPAAGDRGMWERYIMDVPAGSLAVGIELAGPRAPSAYANNGAGLVRVTANAHGYTDGMSITISGADSSIDTTTSGGVNNAWIITGVATNTFDLVGSTFATDHATRGTIVDPVESIYIWGAQLETWDASTNLAPATYIGTEWLPSDPRTILSGYGRGTSVYDAATWAHLRPRLQFGGKAAGVKYTPGEDIVTTSMLTDSSTAISMELLEAAPPQIIFGPYKGRYLFGLRPHKSSTEVVHANYIYWSSPLNGDIWPAQNYIEVAPDGEPLQNGFIYDGKIYVFSMESLYTVYPNPIGAFDFIPQKSACGVGLWKRYALAVGPKFWWLGKEGIYEGEGGQEVSITENSPIRPLFKGQTVNGYLPVNLDADDDELRLVWKDPHLYFFYKDTGGAFKCLRFHTEVGRWEFYDYGPDIRMGLWEQAKRNLLLGDAAGFIYTETGTSDSTVAIAPVIRTGSLDQGEPGALKLYGDVHVEATIPSGVDVAVKPYFDDEGSTVSATNLAGTAARKRYKINLGNNRVQRAVALDFSWTTASTSPILHEADISYRIHADEGTTIWDSDYENDGNLEDKWVHGLYLECDTAGVNHVVRVDIDGTEITGSPFTVNVNGRQMHKISFEPVRGVSLRFYSDTAAQNPGILYDYKWLYSQEPAHLQEPFTWGDLGWPYEKYVKGFAITADTFNQAVTLQVRTNGDESTNPLASSETFTIQHNGPSTSQIRLSHGSTYRLLAETIRLTNTSANPLRIYDLHWDFDREPASLLAHRTQETTFGGTDWAHIRDGYIALRSSATVTLTINVDGTDLTAVTLASTSSLRKKLHFFPVAHKGKVFTFTLTSSAAFKLYLEDCHIWVKPWNQQIGYTKYQIPFEGPRSPTRRLVESLGSLSGTSPQTQAGVS